ncbi:hypothetical protein C6W27_09020 [Bacillus paralicheniformis]|uniref:hypothetical protein n=1 Tax=Bacillus paralicheniformis TaxID=1648923 RepID=UPI000D0351FE|nr:hypothetical protein [Bacillus paralicheniformis]PRS16532.1 hypothetical protein C6W27_09020 [Bacillus paralicheniformis]
MIDITNQIINPIEANDTGERYFSRIAPDMTGELHDRKRKAIHMLNNEKDKTVFDVAVVTCLPVRVIRSLQPNEGESK